MFVAGLKMLVICLSRLYVDMVYNLLFAGDILSKMKISCHVATGMLLVFVNTNVYMCIRNMKHWSITKFNIYQKLCSLTEHSFLITYLLFYRCNHSKEKALSIDF